MTSYVNTPQHFVIIHTNIPNGAQMLDQHVFYLKYNLFIHFMTEFPYYYSYEIMIDSQVRYFTLAPFRNVYFCGITYIFSQIMNIGRRARPKEWFNILLRRMI